MGQSISLGRKKNWNGKEEQRGDGHEQYDKIICKVLAKLCLKIHMQTIERNPDTLAWLFSLFLLRKILL